MNRNMIGQKLKALREKNRYSQTELAQLLGTSEAVVKQWESGQAEPTLSEGLLLSTLYGIDLNDMFVDFDERVLVPQKCVTAFQQAAWLNRYASRWYN